MLEPDTERWAAYIEEHEKAALSETLQGWPNDTRAVTIDWNRLANEEPEFAEAVIQRPRDLLDKAADAVPHCNVPHADDLEGCHVRLKNVHGQERALSDLRNTDTGKLVVVRARVSKATDVRPRMESAAFECHRCGVTQHVPVVGSEINAPNSCDGCERKGPFVIDDAASEARDHQIVELQPRPEEDAMNLQRTLPVHLYDDLVDTVEAGNTVRVTGILKTDPIEAGQKADARRPLQLEGLHIEKEETDFDSYDTKRVDEIEALSERDDLRDALIKSFAPDILTGERGDTHKLACLLQLFGGVRHELPNGDTKRGDVNILLIGAPGTGKSAYLSASDRLAPKSVKASGKGATAAGLTATAVQPEFGDGWMLDAGALVMASGGIACIDEFDKMADSARKSMHEAMEDQVIPINKAGINARLTSQTAVLAAANPEGGSFNRFDNPASQMNLGEALLSRFDLVFALSDTPNADRDREIASHQFNVAEDGTILPEIDADLLREYVAYARQNVSPRFTSEAREQLVGKYVETRQSNGNDEDAPVPVTPRMNESLRRLAEAAARSELSDTVEDRHAATAIELYEMTIGDIGVNDEGELDAMKASGVQPQADKVDRVKGVIRDSDGVTVDEIAERAGMDRDTVAHRVQKFKDRGDVYEPDDGLVWVD
ncbi:hypothetical protein OSG_eHP27_00120 [environmental Halophage eHP-27]|nr:hypothetical protein OSG_eHP27_00120 [environmental Halophage eHP-27]